MIGAGLAGLAAALSLSRAGRRVVIHEAAPQAGGRCRSFHDTLLDRRIDNGNHLLLSANRAALDYLEETGAAETLIAGDGAIPFLDLATGNTWAVPLGGGLLSRMLAPIRRVPGGGPGDLLRLLRLALAGRGTTVMGALGPGALMERFWRPLTDAVLNTKPEEASARLLLATLRMAADEAGSAATFLTARDGLSETFVDPALATLAGRGASVRFGQRLRAIERDGARGSALRFQDQTVALAAGDDVVVAVPPAIAAALLPDLDVPADSSAIVNAHFNLGGPGRLRGGSWLVGLVGGTAQWVFLRGEIASVTVSAADALVDRDSDALLAVLWRDTAAALGQPEAAMPPGRIVKEKRATFRQTPDAVRRRPPARTDLDNLALAGDWTDTGLPATIEGAIRSGRTAASLLSSRDRTVPWSVSGRGGSG